MRNRLTLFLLLFLGIHTVTAQQITTGVIQGTVTDATGARTTYALDALGRTTSVTDALGRLTSSGYDATGRLTRSTDAAGRVTRHEYDAQGRVTAEVDPAGRRSESDYDAAGQLRSQEDRMGRVTRYSYDADGRTTEMRDALGGIVAFDNALWLNRVADPAQRDPDTVAIRELGKLVRADDRLRPLMIPLGDGLLAAVKLST